MYIHLLTNCMAQTTAPHLGPVPTSPERSPLIVAPTPPHVLPHTHRPHGATSGRVGVHASWPPSTGQQWHQLPLPHLGLPTQWLLAVVPCQATLGAKWCPHWRTTCCSCPPPACTVVAVGGPGAGATQQAPPLRAWHCQGAAQALVARCAPPRAPPAPSSPGALCVLLPTAPRQGRLLLPPPRATLAAAPLGRLNKIAAHTRGQGADKQEVFGDLGKIFILFSCMFLVEEC